MSVLINGMDMPTSCYACNFAYQDQDSEHNVYWTCAVDHKAAGMYERREDCPIIEIPPHGRLIDADALKDVQQADADFFKGSSDYGEKCRRDEALNSVANIVNAPTIIDAEEEQHG